MTHKSFGKYIADKLSQMTSSFNEIHKRHIEFERESRELGMTTDKVKIRILKQSLYHSTQGRGNPEHLEQLRLTIQALREELEHERNYQKSLPVILNESCKIFIWLSTLIIIGTFTATPMCGDKDSQFCKDVRKMSGSVEQYFTAEPFILPSNLGK